MTCGAMLLFGALSGAVPTPGYPAAECSPQLAQDCDDPDVALWVTEARDRVLAFDDLAAFAVASRGPAVMCEGSVTSEFDGRQFGTLTLGFEGGLTLTTTTMPPEVGIVTLRNAAGFSDESAIVELLKSYSAGRGVTIDWERPTLSQNDEEEIHAFADPEPGLNAHAWLVYSGGMLVAIRFSMAP